MTSPSSIRIKAARAKNNQPTNLACASTCKNCANANVTSCTSCDLTTSNKFFDNGACVTRCENFEYLSPGTYTCIGLSLVVHCRLDFVQFSLFLLLPQDCYCNGMSDFCDSNLGTCFNCGGNTTGFSCEVCASGYFRPSGVLIDPCSGLVLFFFFFNSFLF